MRTEINILDLFSGIGGFTQGLKQAGFNIKKHYFAEVDKHAQAIYKNQFPKAEAVGDVRHVRGSELGKIHAITFGSPCQDFSMAGKRRGMDGERSSLITEAIRLIDECRPDFFIWENVKGTFSSNNGEDFIAIIKAFANLGGYRIEWQLLNTAWFLPQNRERIYLVGRIADRCKGEVFPITENIKRIDERSKQTPNVRTLTAGGNSGGLHSSMTLIKTIHGKDKVNTIRSGGRGSLSKKHCWDLVKVGAIRGRNPDNPKSRVAGLKTQQMFEENAQGIANTLTSVQKDTVLKESERIRRLTEIECERLQGFTDDWTRWGNYDGQIKEVSGSQRYKCLGNAVTVDVVQAVGESIMRATS